MASKTMSIGTDVATFVLFHPDDLTHRDDSPIAWYAYDFAYRRESQAGKLIAFGTGSDGGYEVRLTTDGLEPRERQWACPGWSFPLVVRHGRVRLDNTDALPGEGFMTDPAEITDYWFDLPNGPYRVTVHPIDWTREPGAVSHNGAVSKDALPSYVICFEAVPSLDGIAVARAVPDLRPRQEAPTFYPSMEDDRRFEWPTRETKSPAAGLLLVDGDTALLPMQSLKLPVSEAVGEAAFPQDRTRDPLEHVLVATSASAGTLAMLSRVTGLSSDAQGNRQMTVQGRQLVTLGASRPARPLPTAVFTPVTKPDMTADADSIEPLRARLLALAESDAAFRQRLRRPNFETERLGVLRSSEAVTGWALAFLAMPQADRLAIYARGLVDRIAILDRFLTDGSLPPQAPDTGMSVLDRLRSIWRG